MVYHIARLASVTRNIMGFTVFQTQPNTRRESSEAAARKVFLNYMGFKDIKEYNRLYPGNLKHESKQFQIQKQTSSNPIRDKEAYKDYLDVFVDYFECVDKFSWMKTVIGVLYKEDKVNVQIFPKMEDIRKIYGCENMDENKLWFCEDWSG